jgi:hypothetical protein
MILNNIDLTTLKKHNYLLHYTWKDVNNKRHCEHEPAFKYFDFPKEETWWFDDFLHRLRGPAHSFVYGNINHFRWYKYDKLHRLNAPADIDLVSKRYFEWGELKLIK